MGEWSGEEREEERRERWEEESMLGRRQIGEYEDMRAQIWGLYLLRLVAH